MNIAFIPVRGGSKSIPLKNIKEINGKPLVYWTIKAANEAKCTDKIIVATDSDKIKNTFPIKEKKHELLTVVSGKLQRVRARAGNRCSFYPILRIYTTHLCTL